MFWIGLAAGYAAGVFTWPHVKDAVQPVIDWVKTAYAKIKGFF